MYDVVIIGAGITGTMLSWKLSRTRLKIAVLEKENDIAEGATMANSAIIHVGYDPEDNTLKAELNVKGAQQYASICKSLGSSLEGHSRIISSSSCSAAAVSDRIRS